MRQNHKHVSENTKDDPNSILAIESMELLVGQNDKKQQIISSTTIEKTQIDPDSVLDIDLITVSKMDNELDPLIPSVQNQNEATTSPVTTPTTNKVFISPKILLPFSPSGLLGSPLLNCYRAPLSPFANNSPNSSFKPKNPNSLKQSTKSHGLESEDDNIFNSPTRDLRTQKQYKSLLEDKSPTLYSETNLYQYAFDKNSKVRVSNEKSFAGDELSKLVIKNVTSAKEQFLARCLNKKIVINTENFNAFVLKVIEFAQANKGVAKVSDGENKWQEFTKENQVLQQFSYKDAKAFSSIYQSVSEDERIYSGRQENLRSDIKVAARLKRIPADLNDRIKESLSQEVVLKSI